MGPEEKKCYFGFDMAKNVNFKLSVDEFFMMSISKIIFLQHVVELAKVLTSYLKHLPLVYLYDRCILTYAHSLSIRDGDKS